MADQNEAIVEKVENLISTLVIPMENNFLRLAQENDFQDAYPIEQKEEKIIDTLIRSLSSVKGIQKKGTMQLKIELAHIKEYLREIIKKPRLLPQLEQKLEIITNHINTILDQINTLQKKAA